MQATAIAPGRQSAAQESLHTYPARFARLWRYGLLAGLVLTVFHWASVTVQATLAAMKFLPLPLQPPAGIFLPGQFLGAHVALFAALMVVYFFYDLFPAVRLSPQGLRISQMGQWRFIPWIGIQRLISTESYARGRLVVFVEVEPGTLGPSRRLAGLLFGVGPRPGFLLTTDLKEFDRLAATIAHRLLERNRPASIGAETLGGTLKFGEMTKGGETPADSLKENYFSPLFKMTLDLPAYLQEVVVAREREFPTIFEAGISWAIIVGAWGVLPFLRDLASGDLQPIVFLLLLFGVALELPVAATGLWALGDLYHGYPWWREVALVYPYTQFARVWAFPWLALGISADLHWLILSLMGLAVAVGIGYLGASLAKAYYRLPSHRAAILGGLVPALYFLIVWQVVVFSL